MPADFSYEANRHSEDQKIVYWSDITEAHWFLNLMYLLKEHKTKLGKGFSDIFINWARCVVRGSRGF